MSIHVNEVVYVLLVLGAILIVAYGLVEIITFLVEQFCNWFTRRQIIRLVWSGYTEYLADLAFFGFALAFLVEKLANIPNITLVVLVRTMTDMSWLWVAVLVSAVLWICAKRTMRKRSGEERARLEGKLDGILTEIKGLRDDLKGK